MQMPISCMCQQPTSFGALIDVRVAVRVWSAAILGALIDERVRVWSAAIHSALIVERVRVLHGAQPRARGNV